MRSTRLIATVCFALLLGSTLGGCADRTAQPAPQGLTGRPTQTTGHDSGTPTNPIADPKQPAWIQTLPPTVLPSANVRQVCEQGDKEGVQGYVREQKHMAHVYSGRCWAAVGTDEFYFYFSGLPKDLDPKTVEAAITAEAPSGAQKLGFSRGQIEIVFDAGKPGEVMAVRLHGPVGPQGSEVDLAYAFKRVGGDLTVELRNPDGTWRRLSGRENIADQPFSLRIAAFDGIDMGALRNCIAQALHDIPYQIEQPSPYVLQINIGAPTHGIQFRFDKAPLSGGWTGHRDPIMLAIPATPHLVLIDPVTGQENTLGEAPAEVGHSSLSPDSQWALLWALKPGTDDLDLGNEQLWLKNTSTGELALTPLTTSRESVGWWSPAVWRNNHIYLFNPSEVETWAYGERQATTFKTEAYQWFRSSPNGRYMVGYDGSKAHVTPLKVVVFDLDANAQQVYPDVTNVLGSPYGVSVAMAWDADSSGLLIQGYEGAGPSGKSTAATVHLDIKTGKIVPASQPPSPSQIDDWVARPDGWKFKQMDDWGPVTVRSPDGKEVSLGTGWVLGWQRDKLLVIRWANADVRRPRYGP